MLLIIQVTFFPSKLVTYSLVVTLGYSVKWIQAVTFYTRLLIRHFQVKVEILIIKLRRLKWLNMKIKSSCPYNAKGMKTILEICLKFI